MASGHEQAAAAGGVSAGVKRRAAEDGDAAAVATKRAKREASVAALAAWAPKATQGSRSERGVKRQRAASVGDEVDAEDIEPRAKRARSVSVMPCPVTFGLLELTPPQVEARKETWEEVSASPTETSYRVLTTVSRGSQRLPLRYRRHDHHQHPHPLGPCPLTPHRGTPAKV